MAFQTIQSFKGVDLKTESTDLGGDPMPLRRAEGALLIPDGSLSRVPIYVRLWTLNNLRQYLPELGLNALSLGVCILLRNEGRMFLVFYDCLNEQSLGSIYAGPDPDNLISTLPTLTAGGYDMQVLATGLTPQMRWSGRRSGTIVIIGNGVDANMALDTFSPVTFRPLNDQMRPLPPNVVMTDAAYDVHADATGQKGNVLYTALEPFFQPIVDAPYRRDRGNYVQISVIEVSSSTFSSTLTGFGTLIDPYIYTVACPVGAAEDQLCNFIGHDPDAQGIVSAQLVGQPGPIQYISPSFLQGGRAQFEPADVFAGPFAAVALTYCLKGSTPNIFSETMPCPVVTCQISSGGRLAVTIVEDTAPYVSRYDTIRIYVADMGASPAVPFGLSSNYYSSFLFALEVPNAAGTYMISPSMLDKTTVMSTEGRTIPPCSMFVFDKGRLVGSGNPSFPMRVFFTKTATTTNLVPEGGNIFDYIDFAAAVVGDAIAALGSYRGQTVVYTKHTAYPLDNSDTTTRYAISTGALNSRTVVTWTNGAQYYLGRDYNIYTLTQPVTDARSEVPDFNLPAPQIGNYLQQYCDTSDTSLAHSVVDTLNKQWWFWLRSKSGAMAGFIFNFETTQLTGPFLYPQFMCAEFLDDGDTRMVGMDLAGNLFWMDVKPPTTIGEPFANASPIALHPATDPADLTLDGYAVACVNINGVTSYVKKAGIIRFQSPWLNFGDAGQIKSFLSFAWQPIQGSAGLVWLTAFNEKGQSVTRYYGDVFGRRLPPRVLLRLRGNLVQFLITVLTGDDLPFSLRNVTPEYEQMGQL
jgi:hypothetical protein